ncbi:hypothetical protein ACFQ71_03100 [Streptomyces sp. NPDC056534]|uniref:hypothetical protein n=1 Tax=Streptomyces sp. NPDC056534 TaxID=3345857 RepID=UPI0036899B4E
MAKLPDDETLRQYFRDGLSDQEIAEMWGCSYQAVNLRFTKMGIERKPYRNIAAAILEAAWPAAEFSRSRFRFNRVRDLTTYMRRRLGDDSLTPRQLQRADRFKAYLERNGEVLSLDWDGPEENPWVFVPRTPSDGRLVVRWPAGRECPKGLHLEAISLPAAPVAESKTSEESSDQ